ncbi:hypothetical protein ACE6H2_010490 [Prunus campanulata]
MIRTRRNPPIRPQRNPSLQNPSSIIDHQVLQGLIIGILLVVDRHHQLEQFIIEYCGEVISWKEAKQRSQAYEIQDLRDAFIISLIASEWTSSVR